MAMLIACDIQGFHGDHCLMNTTLVFSDNKGLGHT
jgi:hypothetical protein